MPTIGNMQYGYDAAGVSNYLDEIKSIVLTEASDTVKDISKIKTVCETEWEGKAREQFLINLQKDANHVADQYNTLYNILISEINSVQAAMANKDESLIKEG